MHVTAAECGSIAPGSPLHLGHHGHLDLSGGSLYAVDLHGVIIKVHLILFNQSCLLRHLGYIFVSIYTTAMKSLVLLGDPCCGSGLLAAEYMTFESLWSLLPVRGYYSQ